MMGSQDAGQAPLFYAFNLEDHIPCDHLLRGIDRFMDLSELRQHLASFYSHTGRPSIDPELRSACWSSAIALESARSVGSARRFT
jgi:transposase